MMSTEFMLFFSCHRVNYYTDLGRIIQCRNSVLITQFRDFENIYIYEVFSEYVDKQFTVYI